MVKKKILKKTYQNGLLRDTKCIFDNNADKNFAGSRKILGPYSREDKKQIFDRSLIHYKMTTCANGMRVWQTYQMFSKNSENLRLESQKNYKKLCFIREPFAIKMALWLRRSQIWQPCRNPFSTVSAFYYA